MPVVVEAVPEEEYNAWVAEQRAAAETERQLTEKDWTLDELMERGEKAYASACASCHQPDGTGMPPAFPALKDRKSTRLNSSHVRISYAVFCLKKKKRLGL